MQVTRIRQERNRVHTLEGMLNENITTYIDFEGRAGEEYGKNTNASKTALLNQITTLRNELLVLAEAIKAY